MPLFTSTCQRLFFQAVLISLAATRCIAKLVNATIDDAYGDTRGGAGIDYTPASAWRDGRLPCTSCLAQPNSALLYNRTWHDSTFTRNSQNEALNNIPTVATAHFSGTGIYVYCALARPDDAGFTTRSDMTFYIDGKEVGTFKQEPPGGDGFDYDALVYKNTELPPGDHEFILQNGRADAPASLVLLDRIVYTYDDGSSAGGSRSNIGAIVGGALGGVAVLCLIGVGTAIFLMKRRRRKLSEENTSKVEGNLAPTPYSISQTQHHAQSPLSTSSYYPSMHPMSDVASTGVGSSSGYNASVSRAYAPPQSVGPHGNEGLPLYEESVSGPTVPPVRHEKGR